MNTESRLLQGLKGKRVMISFKNNTLGNLVIGKFEDADNFIMLLSTNPNKKKDKYDLAISKDIMNYIPISDIESITDVSDEEVYQSVISTIKAQQEAIKAQQAAAQAAEEGANEAIRNMPR
jgi:hypothetical protein